MSRKCTVCFQSKLNNFYSLDCNFSVTSDNKILEAPIKLFKCENCGHIQKIPDSSLLGELYGQYCTNKVLPDEEQAKFDGYAHKRRSAIIVDNIVDFLPDKGSILDIGSGAGGMLKTLSERNCFYNLYANDLNSNLLHKLESINNFKDFYINLSDIDIRFELVTMVHVLEHVVNTENFLNTVSKLLKNDGILVVQVPNISTNIFDIFVYDHISHFNRFLLHRLLSQFFKIVIFPEKQINKEITIIASNKENLSVQNNFYGEVPSIPNFSFLDKMLNEISLAKGLVSVFGTSPISSFFAIMLGDKLNNFYDEDTEKQGREHLGKIILSIDKYNGEPVILPFMQEASELIKKRLKDINFICI